jgi:predicted lipoprotein with Yx(FWY)xxD motif
MFTQDSPGTSVCEGDCQATYAGWPLYYFVKDTTAGDVKGQGAPVSGTCSLRTAR